MMAMSYEGKPMAASMWLAMVILAWVSFGVPDRASAGPGDPVETFGDAGVVRSPIGPAGDEKPAAFSIAPDGSVAVAGIDAGGDTSVVRRYTAGGQADTSFGTGGRVAVPGDGWDVIDVTADGKTLVAGSAGSKLVISRLLADGTGDPDFGTAGNFSFDPSPLRPAYWSSKPIEIEWAAIRVLDDGRIRAVGNFFECEKETSVECPNVLAVGLLADGTPDPEFGDGSGVLALSPVGLVTWALIGPDGGIDLVRSTEQPNEYYGGQSDLGLWRVAADGSVAGGPVELSLTGERVSWRSTSQAIARNAAGDLFIGLDTAIVKFPAGQEPGEVGGNAFFGYLNLLRFVPWRSPSLRIDGLATDVQGRILVSGGFARGQLDGSDRSGFVARLTPGGRPDPTFSNDGFAIGWPGVTRSFQFGTPSSTSVIATEDTIYISGRGPRGPASGFNIAAFESGSSPWLTCDGALADYIGTEGPDSIVASLATVTTLGGDDTISDAYESKICTGEGRDRVDLAGGRNRVEVGAGADTVAGGTGIDLVFGGDGNDRIAGASQEDDLRGGDGDDRLSGEDWNDRLSGGPGDDALYGGASADRLFGNAGRDELRPGPIGPLVSQYEGSLSGVRVRAIRIGGDPARMRVEADLSCVGDESRLSGGAARVEVNQRTGTFREVTPDSSFDPNDFAYVADIVGRFRWKQVAGKLRLIDADHIFGNHTCWTGASLENAWVPFRAKVKPRPRQSAKQ
jgi:uncharacterized delta-60 repeat protein